MTDTRTPPVALVFDLPRVATPGPVPLVFGEASAPALPGVHLVFDQPRIPSPGPVNLVFGDTGGDAPTPGIPDATLSSTAQLSGLRARIAVRVGALLSGSGQVSGLRARVAVRVGAVLAGSGQISGLRIAIAARYDTDTQRPTVGQAASAWAHASAQQGTVGFAHQGATPAPTGWAAPWQHAQDASAPVQHPLPSVLVPAVQHLQAPHQNASSLHGATGFAHQQAAPVLLAQVGKFEGARPVHDATGFAHQDGTKTHGRFAARWQGATPHRIFRRALQQKGLSWLLHRAGRYQEAVPPPPGKSRLPEKPKPPPCYEPGLPVELLFADPHDASQPVLLVFRCDKDEPGPGPGGEPVVVPIRKVYIVINNITLTRVDNGAPLHALSFSASLDVDSWTWQWSASLHSSAADHLGRETDGSPPAVLATINGVPLRLVIERISLNEQFLPQVRYSVSGRGRAAVLSAPWAPVLQHGGQATARTAEQLANEVLQINGVSIGWGIDWQMPEWTVPPGLWSSSGAYIDALSDIATAVGATIQPHPTDAVLRIMPRYPRAPWEWGDLTPDIVIPAAAAQQISTEFMDKPAYNGVYVGGTQAGVFGPVVRTGTVGDVLAPQVTHPLITDATAQRLRGLAVLSDTGKQRRVQLSMQVLPETGLIQPGKLVQIGTGASAYRGLVRSTAVEWAMPRLRQNIELEIHE